MILKLPYHLEGSSVVSLSLVYVRTIAISNISLNKRFFLNRY